MVTKLLKAATFVGFVIVQGTQAPLPPEAYPGQREHRKPPDGWFCSATDKREAHKCQCKRMSTPTAEDPNCCTTPVVEDTKCTVYCHPSHCLCPTKCDAGAGGHTEHKH